MNIGYILLALLLFSAIIFIHELGHYLFARLFRVTVKEFSIGMGPDLVTYVSKKTNIKYALRMFPFGGFVSMAGEDEESDDKNALSKKPVWQRFVIVAAGAAMNILLGILLTVVLMWNATPASNVIAGFAENPDSEISSADSGLAVGDLIVAVNGKSVHIAYETVYTIMHDAYETVDVTVIRDGERKTFSVDFPVVVDESGMVFGDSDIVFTREEKTVIGTFRHSFFYSLLTIRMVWESLGDLIFGRVSLDAVSGPIGITSEITNVAASGNYFGLLYLVILISMNVGVFNLLPIPAMDGGRLFFLLWEMITRKPVPQKIEGLIHGIGLMLLFGLMILICFKDIVALF